MNYAEKTLDIVNYQAINLLEILGYSRPTQDEIDKVESFIRQLLYTKDKNLSRQNEDYT